MAQHDIYDKPLSIFDFIRGNFETPTMQQEVDYNNYRGDFRENKRADWDMRRAERQFNDFIPNPVPTNNPIPNPIPTNTTPTNMNDGQFTGVDLSGMNLANLNFPDTSGQMTDVNLAEFNDAANVTQPVDVKPPTEEPGFFDKIGSGMSDFFGDEERMARMTIALNSMRLNPDPNIAKSMENKLESLRKGKGKNATVIQLRAKGRDDLADAVESGSMKATTAWTLAFKPPSSFQEKLDFIKDKTPEEIKFYKESGILGGGVNIDMGAEVGDKSFYDKINKAVVTRIDKFQEESQLASASMNSFDALSKALQDFGATGTFEQQKQQYRELADRFGLGDFIDYRKMAAGQTVEAFTNMTVANELRKNKGPQTDFDATFAKTYVPSLGNRPEANIAIMHYGQSIAKQKQLLGDIARTASLERPDVARKIIKNLGDIEAHMPGAIESPNGKWITFIEYYNDPKQANVPAMDRLMTWTNAYRKGEKMGEISIYKIPEENW
jgi:hypothetical protein